MSLVIAFAGPAAHGKTTCAQLAEDYLISKGYIVKTIAFADRLKEACKIIFRLTDKDVNNHIAKSTIQSHLGVTPRVVMQKFGTEICRDGIKEHLPLSDTIWTWNVEQDILENRRENTVVIIPDLRFTDEQEMLRRYNSVLINVIRPGYRLIETSSHLSEQGLELGIKSDYEIVNDVMNDNFMSLKQQIELIINQSVRRIH